VPIEYFEITNSLKLILYVNVLEKCCKKKYKS
jgi:hypothetical protein